MEPIRVLYVNGGIMQRGGIESYMMNYYRHIDRTKIQIDFIVHGFKKGVYDDEIIRMGGIIYNIPVKSKDYIGNVKELKRIFKTGKYQIVHSHMDAMSMVVLKIAKQCGIPIRIAHSHNTQHLTNNKIKIMVNEYARKRINKYATERFACSEVAGRWLFGDKTFENGNVVLINNAIELDKFKFKEDKRKQFRKELGIEDEIVIGHIGRFDYQKNHSFLLEIFNETLKKLPNIKLILVGEGHLKQEIEKKIIDLGIQNNVIMTGSREDVNELLNVFDIFIFPSLFEGLGIVLIEAQVNGLPCIASKAVPTEVNLDKLVSFIEIENSLSKWSNKINEIIEQNITRVNNQVIFKNRGYDIAIEAKKLQKIYISLLSK